MDSRSIIRRFFDEFANQGKLEVGDEILADDVAFRNPPMALEGKERFKQFMGGLRTSFPDLHFAVQDEVAQDDLVAIRWLLSGTQKGVFISTPPTGRRVEMMGSDFFHLAGGKITAIYATMDMLGMLRQIGALPP